MKLLSSLPVNGDIRKKELLRTTPSSLQRRKIFTVEQPPSSLHHPILRLEKILARSCRDLKLWNTTTFSFWRKPFQIRMFVVCGSNRFKVKPEFMFPRKDI